MTTHRNEASIQRIASTPSLQDLFNMIRAVLVRRLEIMQLLVEIHQLLLTVFDFLVLLTLDVRDGCCDEPARTSAAIDLIAPL